MLSTQVIVALENELFENFDGFSWITEWETFDKFYNIWSPLRTLDCPL